MCHHGNISVCISLTKNAYGVYVPVHMIFGIYRFVEHAQNMDVDEGLIVEICWRFLNIIPKSHLLVHKANTGISGFIVRLQVDVVGMCTREWSI